MIIITQGKFITNEPKQDSVNIEMLRLMNEMQGTIDILQRQADDLQSQIDTMNFPGYDGGDSTITSWTSTYDGGDATSTWDTVIEGGEAI